MTIVMRYLGNKLLFFISHIPLYSSIIVNVELTQYNMVCYDAWISMNYYSSSNYKCIIVFFCEENIYHI